MMEIKRLVSKMVLYFIALFIFAIAAFYIAYKATEPKKKAKTSNSVIHQAESKPSLERHVTTLKPVYQRKPIKLYPDLSCSLLNLLTKKARKEYRNFTVIDFETTGLSPTTDSIIEIGAVKIKNGIIADSFSTLINPGHDIPIAATKINGITNEMVKDAPNMDNIIHQFFDFIGDDVLVAHNASFDLKFLLVAAYDNNLKVKNVVVDTLQLCRKLYPELPNHKLGTVAKHLYISMDNAHRSLCDAMATASIVIKCIELLDERDVVKERSRKMAKETAN